MKSLLSILLLLNSLLIFGQGTHDINATVRINAVASSDLECVDISWIADPGVSTYQIFKKAPEANNWGSAVEALNGDVNNYQDCEIEEGEKYEYRVLKILSVGGQGNGYITAGLDVPAKHFNGGVIALIDEISYDSIGGAIDQYLKTIELEGWGVVPLVVSRDSSVIQIKEQIRSVVEAQNNINSIVILGHVPVPHSGNIFPDGHNNHQGAWSADLYYGELDGVWTDQSINNVTSSNSKNHNVPGDGRFDNSNIPNNVDIAVGRIDFNDLPLFEEDEFELLKRYIDKSIAYRRKLFTPRQRAMIDENFNRPEAFASGAIRGISTILGSDSIEYGVFADAFESSYLWAYGSGGGSYTSAGGICNSARFASDSLQSVFIMLFGSYFGDYDSRNNFMRSALASGSTLSCAWSGRPHWNFHPMALGATLGECTLLTQNNNFVYTPGFGARSIHVNLLGDPTLTSFVVDPPKGIEATEVNGHINLVWKPSDKAEDGHYLYRRLEGSTSYELVADDLILGSAYIDSCLMGGQEYEYLVRAAQKTITGSGSYYNLSGGVTTRVLQPVDHSVKASFDVVIDEDVLTATNLSTNATQYKWLLPDGTTLDSVDLTINLANNVNSELILIASNACNSDTISETFFYSKTTELEDDLVDVSPNPVVDILHVNSDLKVASMQIVGLDGRTIISVGNQDEINVRSLNEGMYLLRIEDVLGNITVKRFIKGN